MRLMGLNDLLFTTASLSSRGIFHRLFITLEVSLQFLSPVKIRNTFCPNGFFGTITVSFI